MHARFTATIVLTLFTVANAGARGFAPWADGAAPHAAPSPVRASVPDAGFAPWRRPSGTTGADLDAASGRALRSASHGFAPWARGGA